MNRFGGSSCSKIFATPASPVVDARAAAAGSDGGGARNPDPNGHSGGPSVVLAHDPHSAANNDLNGFSSKSAFVGVNLE